MDVMFLLIWVMVLHFIGDFIFQSEWMARNKSKDDGALGFHACVYTAILAIGVFPLILIFNIDVEKYLLFFALNYVCHLWTDFLTSRMTSKAAIKARETDRWHDFFVIVGLDQLIHFLTLTVTVIALLK